MQKHISSHLQLRIIFNGCFKGRHPQRRRYVTIGPLLLAHSLSFCTKLGLRQDARRPYELRSTSFQLSTHSSSDGSSTATQGLTTVEVSVFGPREPRNRGLASHDRAVVSVEVGVVPWAAGAGARRTRGDK